MAEAPVAPAYLEEPFQDEYGIEDGLVYVDSKNEIVQFTKSPSPTVSPNRNIEDDRNPEDDTSIRLDAAVRNKDTITDREIETGNEDLSHESDGNVTIEKGTEVRNEDIITDRGIETENEDLSCESDDIVTIEQRTEVGNVDVMSERELGSGNEELSFASDGKDTVEKRTEVRDGDIITDRESETGNEAFSCELDDNVTIDKITELGNEDWDLEIGNEDLSFDAYVSSNIFVDEDQSLQRPLKNNNQVSLGRSMSVEFPMPAIDAPNFNATEVNSNGDVKVVRSQLLTCMRSLPIDDNESSESTTLSKVNEENSQQDAIHENAVRRNSDEALIPRARDSAKEALIDQRIMEIRKKNEERMRRAKEVEEDKANSCTFGKSYLTIEEGNQNYLSETLITEIRSQNSNSHNTTVQGIDSENARNTNVDRNVGNKFTCSHDYSRGRGRGRYHGHGRGRGRGCALSNDGEETAELGWRRHADSGRGPLDKNESRRITREEQRRRNIRMYEAELEATSRRENARMEATRVDTAENHIWEERQLTSQGRREERQSFHFEKGKRKRALPMLMNQQRNSRVHMTGREEQAYDEWKSERNKIEAERLKPIKQVDGNWRREWDRGKVWDETMEQWVALRNEIESKSYNLNDMEEYW